MNHKSNWRIAFVILLGGKRDDAGVGRPVVVAFRLEGLRGVGLVSAVCPQRHGLEDLLRVRHWLERPGHVCKHNRSVSVEQPQATSNNCRLLVTYIRPPSPSRRHGTANTTQSNEKTIENNRNASA